ncbi:pyridoxal phosphate-dependent aminotransferase [Thermosulfurimonas marina]|uniref:Aminotransferase n=1 Tax=Thermosulfurimonas marina TaxID=2047767 RepID=A0A6H1WS44_9BACT|nr:pyridoxal phosphate-dependent aminotransferase [Thermosulfurimonas marina]QJA06002.1 pyridoxal phosphate-dependent aminotransferase [Thermosulfurimonas marina]
MKLSERIRRLKPSATLAVDARAKELRAQGVDVINLSAGEPDFDTPAHIREAAKRALDEGFTRYLPAAGLPELREAVCFRLKEDYGFEYRPAEVLITCGAKQALYNLAQALLDPGDEVLILAPYWVSYPPIVELAGGVPVIVPSSAEENFEPTPEELEARLSERTRGLILNSPSNPTGTIYSRDFLAAVAEMARRHGLWIISDDIYDRLRFDGARPENLLSVAPDLRERVFLVNGVSKAYAMTGWRIGWAVGPEEVIRACAKLQGQSTSNATAFAQKAAVVALSGPQDCVEEMRRAFAERAAFLFEALSAIPGIRPHRPKGTFYLFADFSSFYGRRSPSGKEIRGSVDLATYLLEEGRVATVPGVAFGEDRFLRLSFAQSLETLKEAVSRLEAALAELR